MPMEGRIDTLSSMTRYALTALLLWAAGPVSSQTPRCSGRFYQNEFHSIELGADGSCKYYFGAGGVYGVKKDDCALAETDGQWTINGGAIRFSDDCSAFDWLWRGAHFAKRERPPELDYAPPPAALTNWPSALPEAVRTRGEAVVRLRGAGGRRTCSGFWVSEDGFLLTAAHCFAAALEALDLGRFAAARSVRGVKIDNRLPFKLVEGRGDFDIDGVAHARPVIVALGTGGLIERPAVNGAQEWNTDEAGLRMSREMALDFVLLKYDLAGARVPCIPIETSRLQPDISVWSFGRPSGSELLVSGGKSAESFEALKTLYPMEKGKEGDPVLAAIMVYSDLRVRAGMSGGPLVNSDGGLVGINSFGLFYGLKVSEKSAFVRASAVYDEIAVLAGEARAREFFSCR